MTTPRHIVGVGEILSPVCAPGLLTQRRGGDQRGGDRPQVGHLPRIRSSCDRAPAGPPRFPEGGERPGGGPQALGTAQYPRAGCHRPGQVRAGHRVGEPGRAASHHRVRGPCGGRQPAGEVGGDPGGEDQSFQQTVGRQPVRAVHACARDLTAGVETGDAGAAPAVRPDTTAGVVRRRGDRDRHTDRVHPGGTTACGDRREPPQQRGSAQPTGIQVQVVDALSDHHTRHLLRHDIARGEICQRVDARHDSAAGGVHQPGALAAHGLTDQWLLAGHGVAGTGSRIATGSCQPQRGRVELDELQVGDDRPGAQGQRHAIARRHRRVRG